MRIISTIRKVLRSRPIRVRFRQELDNRKKEPEMVAVSMEQFLEIKSDLNKQGINFEWDDLRVKTRLDAKIAEISARTLQIRRMNEEFIARYRTATSKVECQSAAYYSTDDDDDDYETEDDDDDDEEMDEKKTETPEKPSN